MESLFCSNFTVKFSYFGADFQSQVATITNISIKVDIRIATILIIKTAMIEVCFAPMPPPITSWSIKPTKAATAKVALTVPAQNTFNILKCNNQNWFVLCFLCRGQEIIFGLTLFLADYASTILDFFPPGVAVMDHKETFAEMGNLG